MNAREHNVPRQRVPSRNESGRALRLMKWLVLIALLVLILLALLLPDRGLAASDAHRLAGGSHEGEIAAIQPHMLPEP